MKFTLNENSTHLILKEATKAEFNQLNNTFNPYSKGYMFTEEFKRMGWNGRKNFFNKGKIAIGLWKVLTDNCKKHGYPFILENRDNFPRDREITLENVEDFCLDFYKHHKTKDGDEPFYPYEHQIQSVFQMLKNKLCTIEVATSGGKTLIFSTVIFYLLKKFPDFKFLLIVPSITLVTQFYDDILDSNHGFNRENLNPCDLCIQEVMGDNNKPRRSREDREPNIYVGTYQSLIDYGTPENQPDFYKKFNVMCIDEAHKAANRKINIDGNTTENLSQINTIANRCIGYSEYRFGMSGTFPNESTAESYSIQSITGPIVNTVSTKYLTDNGLVTLAKIKCLILQHKDVEFAQAVKKIGGKKAYDLEMKYIQESTKRTDFIVKLTKKFDANSLILFHNKEYGKHLFERLSKECEDKNFFYIDGDTSNKEREIIKKHMESIGDKPNILIASYGTLSTGVSIKALKYLIMTQPFKSDSLIRQSIGRLLRLHKSKDKAIIYDLIDQFHSNFDNVLQDQYKTRKNDIYIKQEFEYSEITIVL